MASPTASRPIDHAGLKGPAKEFATFCETERAHRRHMDPNFDAQSFDDAVALILERLAAFKKEDLA
jgi:hypothetical protein